MFITFIERLLSPSVRESFDELQDYFANEVFEDVDLDKQPSATITKAFYKLNRSINKSKKNRDYDLTSNLVRDMGKRFDKGLKLDSLVDSGITITTQLILVKAEYKNANWISEDQKKAIFAILLFLETIPYKVEKDCSDDAYLILLLPHLDEIIFNSRIRHGKKLLMDGFLNLHLMSFETLKKMFMVRLKLGFGSFSKKDISAKDLSLLAKQNNLKSIQNAVSKGDLRVLGGKGPSQSIDSQSARDWLTSKIKNRLTHFSWFVDGPILNSRIELRYLNYFKVKYFQILCLSDLEQLEDCPDKGVFQLIIGYESKKNICYGHSEENLKKKLEIYFTKELKKAHDNSVNESYSTIQFHLLVYEPKSHSDIRISPGILLLIEKDLRKTVNYIDLNPID